MNYWVNYLFAAVLLMGLSHFIGGSVIKKVWAQNSNPQESRLGGGNDAALHKKTPNSLKLKTFDHLKGQFLQSKILKELDVEIKTEGHFEIAKADSTSWVFHWNVEKPKPSLVCMDSKNVVLTSGGKKKKISLAEMGTESSQQMTSLLKLISLNPDFLSQDFNIQPLGADFLLIPKKPETVFFKSAQIHVNPQGLVEKILIIEKSKGKLNDELHIQFSKLETNQVKKLAPCDI